MAEQSTRAQRQQRLNALFAARHAVSRRDLLALGLSRDDIDGRLRGGTLERAYRGVYTLAGAPRTREQRWAAAVLACGPSAGLSHLSAAALWMPMGIDPVVIDVSMPGGVKRTRNGVRTHRPTFLDPQDITIHRGIPVTTVPRTLIDLALVVSQRLLERLLDEAERPTCARQAGQSQLSSSVTASVAGSKRRLNVKARGVGPCSRRCRGVLGPLKETTHLLAGRFRGRSAAYVDLWEEVLELGLALSARRLRCVQTRYGGPGVSTVRVIT